MLQEQSQFHREYACEDEAGREREREGEREREIQF